MSSTKSARDISPYSMDVLKETFFTFVSSTSTTEGSTTNSDYENRHIYGYENQSEHELSMLQIITATVLLDYQSKQMIETETETETNNRMTSIQEEIVQTLEKYGPVLNIQSIIQKQQPAMTLAAEFKRASPSKGLINNGNAGEQGLIYANTGASIISVLTEQRWFQGSLHDLTQVRQSTTPVIDNIITTNTNIHRRTVAILRKDFIINEYMILEAIAAGADTVLLIVAILSQHTLQRLINYCRIEHNIEPLVEVHTDLELDVAIAAGACVIGVNNRNLHTFQLDMTTTERIATKLQSITTTNTNTNTNHYTLCALSGMSTCYDVDRYRQCNVQMCLIGESLMRSTDPAAAIASLCLHPNDFIQYTNRSTQTTNASSVSTDQLVPGSLLSASAYTRGTQLIKICGITTVSDAIQACQDGANLIGLIFASTSKRCIGINDAIDIVTAVRAFGERNERLQFDLSNHNNTNTNNTSTNTASPLLTLIGSSRCLMQTIRQPNRPAIVGVFQNQSIDYINEIITTVGLDIIQLHGSEGMQASNPYNYTPPTPVIRVIDIPTTTTTTVASSSSSSSDVTVDTILQGITSDPYAILLDTSIKGSKDGGGGGTGVQFDWTLVEQVQNRGLPIIVAGGLTPHNVKDCIISIRPFGIDCSSGVEDINVPGIKNQQKLHDYIISARQAAANANEGF